MQKPLIIVILLTIITQALHAGAANGALDCIATNKGGSGIQLQGSVPIDMEDFELNLQNKHGKLMWNDAMGNAQVVVQLQHKVFTLTVAFSDGKSLLLYALPSSIKHSGEPQRLFEASFDAILEHAPRPGLKAGSNQDIYVRNVPLRCTLSHSI
jgi:hypothetical protein